MSNLTITIDDGLLQRARIRALEQGTSVNALVRAYLEAFAGADKHRTAAARLIQLSKVSRSGSGTGGRTWARDELHDRDQAARTE